MKNCNSSLNNLIKLYGEPSALIDNFQSKNKGYAIWGYKNKFSYDLKSIIINNKKVSGDPFNLLQDLFDNWVLTNSKIKSIGFLGYDIKNILYPHIKFKTSHTKHPCLWFAQPAQVEEYELTSCHNRRKEPFLNLKQDLLSLDRYKFLISKIKEELKKGNSYQINLTAQKIFSFKNISPFEIYLEVRDYVKPAFGYFINTGDEQILSFSPEEFFHTNGSKI